MGWHQMTLVGASRNYKVGPKNNWRRTVWNEILRRTNGREQTEIILYLAGPQDLDRAIAVEKGVPTQNMVAIDIDCDNVASVRQQRLPVLSSDVFAVLRAWPKSQPVCAVILDFCSGLTLQGLDVYDVFERPPLRNAVVMVNFMRGRDAFTNAIRAMLTDEAQEWPMPPCHMIGGENTFHLSEKHRALQFLTLHAIETWQVLVTHFEWNGALNCLGIGLAEDVCARYSQEQQDEYLQSMWFIFANRIFDAMRPTFFSYKSGPLTFDSAVFQHIARNLDKAPLAVQRILNKEAAEKFVPDPAITRKISAMLAVRTMRQ
jgi:hypothetical protein